MKHRSIGLAALPFAFLTSAAATFSAPSANTSAACSAIYAAYPQLLIWDPLGPNGTATFGQWGTYNTINTDYWNGANANNRAACVFIPDSAQSVSAGVKILNKYPDVNFALKSGGHNANLGFSSVNQGVLLSFRPNLQNTTISKDLKTAYVGPGSRWDEAMTVLDPYGKAIVGGRLGHVGVGGYMLGGGLSFLTSQYGFAADTVTAYEVVLADGSIVSATRTQNSDLYYALQGGGNRFGIITKFSMKTFSIGDVWGGVKIYNGADYAQIISATTNFTANNKDPQAAVIVTFDFAFYNLVDVIVMFYFYNGPTPPAGIFDEYDAVQPISDNTKTQTYPELLIANNEFSLSGFRYQIREGTYPNMPHANMTSFLDYHYNIFKKESLVLASKSFDIQAYSFAIQPIPVMLAQASLKAGGNRLGLDPNNGDRIFMEYDLSWANTMCDTVCPGYIEKIVNQIKKKATTVYGGIAPTNYKSGNIAFTNFNPIFMNDGMFDQSVYQSYGQSTYQKLKSIQLQRDPKGFFMKRQDGFTF